MHRILSIALIASLGVGTLAKHIAEPERKPHPNGKNEQAIGLQRTTHTTADGVNLAYLFVPAAKRDLDLRITRVDGDNLRFNMRVNKPKESVPVRGSVIYLHGWSNNGDQFTPWALTLSEQGYAGVLVDLRSHGDSGNAPVSYGPREAADISDLVRALLESGRIKAPVYLMGTSYGGSVALFAEPALRDVVEGIVAFAPFPSATDGIRGAINEARNAEASGITARITLAALRRMDDTDIDAAIQQAGKSLDADLRSADARPKVAASQTCLLLLHGGDDRMFSPESSKALAALSPMASAVTLPEHGHTQAPLRADWLGGAVGTWMAGAAEHEAGKCPSFVLPELPIAAK